MNKDKILGHLSEETHTAVLQIKLNHKLKSVEETLKYLLSVYNKDKIRVEVKREEDINNSNIKEIEKIKDIY